MMIGDRQRHCDLTIVLLAELAAVLSRHRSEEHTSELQSLRHLVCRLLLEKKKRTNQSELDGEDVGVGFCIGDQLVSEPPVRKHFFFNDTATTEIYTLSLHDALPICYWSSLCATATPMPTSRFTEWTPLGSISRGHMRGATASACCCTGCSKTASRSLRLRLNHSPRPTSLSTCAWRRR